LDWFTERALAVSRNPISFRQSSILLSLLLVGLVTIGLRRRAALPVLLLPVGVVTAAGLAGSYPISGRLALFLIPMTALALAAPIDLPSLAARVGWRPGRVAAIVVAAATAGATVLGLVVLIRPHINAATHELGHPRRQEESRPILQYLADHRLPGDLVLVDGRGARYAAAFYGPRVELGSYRVLEGGRSGVDCPPGWLGAELRDERRYTRIWLFSSHTNASSLRMYRAHLDRFGRAAQTVSARGAAATRFDRTAVPSAPPSAPPQCLQVKDPAELP
jgi:hypothetical protein